MAWQPAPAKGSIRSTTCAHVKRYLYRAVDEYGQVVDVLLRERRDLASAQAFFRRARGTA